MNLDLGDTKYPVDDARAKQGRLDAEREPTQETDLLAQFPDAKLVGVYPKFITPLVRDGFRIACFDLDMSRVNSAP
jgi:hypothetical protein